MASILVVEDNPLNMELVVYLLETNGMVVTQAFDGPQALLLLTNNSFDLILLDIQLPGMDGMEVLEKIKENPALKSIPVIALTAHAMQGDEQKFIEAGCIGYISKPIDVLRFPELIKSFISKGTDL
ncbi:MAG: response regulator [Methanomethylovorans sp.]|jgi:two-component system cell cycle response regulator DivK|nr:response regulator [Methanomethylovorans sp.]